MTFDRKVMITPFNLENSKLEIFKVSVRNHFPCDIIKRQKRGEAVICNGDHTNLICFNFCAIPNISAKKDWLEKL